MERMKGHEKPRKSIKNEPTDCNADPFLRDFVCRSLRWHKIKPLTLGQTPRPRE